MEIREGRIAAAEYSRAHTVKEAGDDWIRGCFLKSFLKLRTGQETPRLYGAVDRQWSARKPPDSKGAADLIPRVQRGFRSFVVSRTPRRHQDKSKTINNNKKKSSHLLQVGEEGPRPFPQPARFEPPQPQAADELRECLPILELSCKFNP